MSDIVEDLRGRARGYRIGPPSAAHTAVMLEEAADEITRLRTQNAELEKHCQLMAMEDAGYAVIKRLTDENAGLRAQNAELLEALRPIACKCSIKGEGAGGYCTTPTGECSCWTARAVIAKVTKSGE